MPQSDWKAANDPILRLFTFVIFTTQAVIVSFFPVYFDSLGFSKTQIGLIYSSGPLLAIGSNLIWGLISDRFQTLKKTIEHGGGGTLSDSIVP